MTQQLKETVDHLPPRLARMVETYAKDLAATVQPKPPNAKPRFRWVGALKNGPWKTGLEAQEAAKHYRIFLLERSMRR